MINAYCCAKSRIGCPLIGNAFLTSPDATSVFTLPIFILTILKCTGIPIQPDLSRAFALLVFIRLIFVILLVINIVGIIIVVVRWYIVAKWQSIIPLDSACQWRNRLLHIRSKMTSLVIYYIQNILEILRGCITRGLE